MKLKDCKKCDLYKTRTQVVLGRGPKNPKLLFIGEAPGREEDLDGKPFVGQAGKVLDGLIDGIGLSRKDVYISNVLLCRPPSNRRPNVLEIAACKERLMKVIKRFDCPVICLGRTAAEAVIGPKFRYREWCEVKGRSVFATYHPAYYLRQQNQLWKARGDFARIKFYLQYGEID